ncbi:uncharacterized protein [Oscarella lobularis]|uniref:uncharacterized protein n=1 Tax=Oscarella lobularis TaxID=121494 RepID=UPI0033142BD8
MPPTKAPKECPFSLCRYTSERLSKVYEHIRHCHKLESVPAEYLATHGLAPCPDCGQIFKSLTRHYPQCNMQRENGATAGENRPDSLASGHATITSSLRSTDSSARSEGLEEVSNSRVDSSHPTEPARPSLAVNRSARPESNSQSSTSHVEPHVPSSASLIQGISLARLASSPRPTSEPGMSSTQQSDRLEGYAFLSTLVFDDLCSVISPSIENIPGNLQGLYLQCCRMTFEEIVDDPTNIDKWKLLFLLPRLILQPSQAEGSDDFDLDRKARIRLFPEKKWGTLFDASHLAETSSPDRDIGGDVAADGMTPSALGAAVEKKVRHGEISRAGHLLTSKGLAPPSDDTFHKLEQKHPSAPRPTLPHIPDDVAPIQASFNTLRQVLRDSPRGSGGGCDGWRFEHLRLLLGNHEVLLSFLAVCNHFLAGTIPTEAATAFAGARLIALCKVWCFYSWWFGVVHLLQLSLSQHPDWVLLKTDARNAFNSVSRQRFLDLVNEHFPTLQAFVYACYAVPPSLVLLHEDGFRCIKSEEGVQQGDPLGPFLFSLALQSCLVAAHAAASEGFVISYLDDAVIGGPVDSVVSAYQVLCSRMHDVGLVVRPDKCQAFSPCLDTLWPLQDIGFTSLGMSVLGCPIGTDSYVAGECLRIVAEENAFLERLCGLRNMQSALLLLRYCGTGRINHLLRAIPPSTIQQAVQQHDSNIRSCFCSIIGCQLDNIQLRQLHLRLSQGGMGLPLAERTSPCAFLGAWAATLASLPSRLEQFPSALDVSVAPSDNLFCGHVAHTLSALSQATPAVAEAIPSIATLSEKHLKLQRVLSHLLLDAEHAGLLSSANRFTQARLRSAAGPDAGAWLDAIPASRHLSFTNAEFQTAVMEAKLVATIWLSLLRSVNYHCELEGQGDFGDFKRPDISIYDYQDGKKLLLDVSIIHPQRPGCLPQSHSTNGAAAIYRDTEKSTKYRAEATSLGYLFEPLTFEVFGRWSPVAVDFFKKIVRRPSIEFLDDRPAAARYWRRRFAVCLLRLNAQILLRKVTLLVPGSTVGDRLGPHDTDIRFFSD